MDGERLVIIPHDLKGREFSLNWFQKEDKIRFEWEEHHCGDTDTYETIEITLGELFELLNINHAHEERQKVLAGRELDTTIERLRKTVNRQQHENWRLKEVEKEHIALLKAIDKVKTE